MCIAIHAIAIHGNDVDLARTALWCHPHPHSLFEKHRLLKKMDATLAGLGILATRSAQSVRLA